MKIKELREKLKGLPADMEVVIDTGLQDGDEQSGYGSIAFPARKVKTKLVKKTGEYTRVQSRPHKDEKAKLVLVFE